jgi:hypothetical protein
MTTDELVRPTPEDELRERAVKRLKKRSDFHAHLLMYVLVNSVFVGIWAMTHSGFFWPAFPMMGWGIGLIANAWDVYRDDEPTEDRIRREMEHLQGTAGRR